MCTGKGEHGAVRGRVSALLFNGSEADVIIFRQGGGGQQGAHRLEEARRLRSRRITGWSGGERSVSKTMTKTPEGLFGVVF